MKNKELFDKTVNVLVKAYQNNALEHSNCHACAVGNICREASELTGNHQSVWGYIFSTFKKDGKYIQLIAKSDQYVDGDTIKNINESFSPIHFNICKEKALELIKTTGYTVRELAKIEYAFETAEQGNNKDEWMFNGLLAVYDILCNIHEVDREEVEKGDLVFIKC